MLTEHESRMIGGSDLAGIVGLSPWQTPLSIYARVKGAAHEGARTPAQRRGILLEPAVREMYREDRGATLLGGVKFTHPRAAYLRASLDDVAIVHGRRRPLEIKTASPSDAALWGEAGTDGVPDYYLTQVMYYIGAALEVGAIDEPEADVAVLLLGVDDAPRILHVRHDADVYGWLLEQARRFWTDHVEANRPPSPTMPAKEAEAVRRLYRKEREPLADFATLAPEDRAVVLAYAEARRNAAVAEAAFKAAEVRLQLALGWRAGVDNLPPDSGLRRLTWKMDTRGKVAWKDAYEALAKETGAASALVQRVAEAHRGEPPRVLRVTETKETE